MHARVGICTFKPSTAETAIKMAQQSLLPIVPEHKGFHAFEVRPSRPGTIVSFSTQVSEGEALEAVNAGQV